MRGTGGINRKTTTPVNVPRTRRQHNIRNLTSLPAGKAVPIAVIPLLREDAASVNVQIAFEMQETVEVLLNSVNVVVEAWLFPNLADTHRFRTMDDIDLAYTGNAREGEVAQPWVEKILGGAPGANQVLMRLGKHYKPTDMINAGYNVAYNGIWNHRAQNISPKIELRDRLQTDLAQAFWPNNQFQFIVPDYDQAAMEGEVGLTVVDSKVPIKGIRIGSNGAPLAFAGRDSVNDTTVVDGWAVKDANNPNVDGNTHLIVESQPVPGGGFMPDIWGEFQKYGVTVSLANIAMAQKTQVWAQVRKKYAQLPEDMFIDLLMDGITITEQGWRQPIPLGKAVTQFGMAKRYASNGEALTQSVVNGAAAVEMRVSTPRVPCGGVIMFIAEIAPEQLFERMEDPYLHLSGADVLPAYLPDMADPEKVDIVLNRRIDIDHDEPDDTYGYEPLNARWNQTGPGIGGRFYRPEVDAPFDEDRQMFWAVETQNPVLSKDAYLVPEDIHLKPFWTATIDPFDAITIGGAQIVGNTVFGGTLIEATGVSDYDKVLERIPQERIQKD